MQASQGGNETRPIWVSKQSYANFAMRVEFWASDDANSGVFLRCQDRGTITDEKRYEANIFDQRPDTSYGTGAIVKVAKVSPMPKAGRQVEHLRDHRARDAAHPRPERRQL